ncbi:AMP-binding protein [Deltaproteobacteria bacterium TL4]
MPAREKATIVHVAQQHAMDHPDKNHIIFLDDGDDQETCLTFKQLDLASKQVGGALQHHGVSKGDRAFVILPSSLEFIKIFYGCLYAGVMPVPLAEPGGPKQMLAYMENFVPTLKASQPKLLVATVPMVAFLRSQLPPQLQPIFAKLTILSDQELLAETDRRFEQPEIKANDTAYLQFSSGSTGTPKGIMVGHRNILANMEQARIFGDWEAGRGTALWLPLFHDFGLAAGMLGAMYNGGFVSLMTPAHFIRKPFRWVKMMSKYQCAYSYAPPFGYDLCVRKVSAEDKKGLDLSSMVSSVIGAEPVHYSATKAFNDFYADCGLKPTVVRPGFGMAETVIMFSESEGLSALTVDRNALENEKKLKLVDETEEDRKVLINLGTHMHGHEIVIKGPNDEALPEGEVGEITIGGPSVCQGYYNNPEATEKTFRQKIKGKEGVYLNTGDLGLLWKGNLYFAGRIKDIIIIRGRNYYPQDLEFVLFNLEEIRPGCAIAYAVTSDENAEHLALAIEVQKDLLKDMNVFEKYILPALDKKVVEHMGLNFQIHPAERLYLKPGTITKTSSGKVKHQANKIRFIKEQVFEGLLQRIVDEESESPQATEQGIKETIVRLFKEIVKQNPVLDVPIADLGGDSMAEVEFLDAVERKYPVLDLEAAEEFVTLNDLIHWLEARVK